MLDVSAREWIGQGGRARLAKLAALLWGNEFAHGHSLLVSRGLTRERSTISAVHSLAVALALARPTVTRGHGTRKHSAPTFLHAWL
jgi:hypothetical protein